jgi:hypothetical protein
MTSLMKLFHPEVRVSEPIACSATLDEGALD